MGIPSSFGSALGALAKKLGLTEFMAGLREGAGARSALASFDFTPFVAALAPLIQQWLPQKAVDSDLAALRFGCDQQGRLTVFDTGDRYADLPPETRVRILRVLKTYEEVLQMEAERERHGNVYAEPWTKEEAMSAFRKAHPSASGATTSGQGDAEETEQEITVRWFFAPDVDPSAPLRFFVDEQPDTGTEQISLEVPDCRLVLLDKALGAGKYRVLVSGDLPVTEGKPPISGVIVRTDYEVLAGTRDAHLLTRLHEQALAEQKAAAHFAKHPPA